MVDNNSTSKMIGLLSKEHKKTQKTHREEASGSIEAEAHQINPSEEFEKILTNILGPDFKKGHTIVD